MKKQLEQFLKDESTTLNFPWILDTCNERELIIKDAKGNQVIYEAFCELPELPPIRFERYLRDAHGLARKLVELTEILAP